MGNNLPIPTGWVEDGVSSSPAAENSLLGASFSSGSHASVSVPTPGSSSAPRDAGEQHRHRMNLSSSQKRARRRGGAFRLRCGQGNGNDVSLGSALHPSSDAVRLDLCTRALRDLYRRRALPWCERIDSIATATSFVEACPRISEPNIVVFAIRVKNASDDFALVVVPSFPIVRCIVSVERILREASKRCMVRAHEPNHSQPYEEPPHHMPTKVCVEPLYAASREPALRIVVHHTASITSAELHGATFDDIAFIFRHDSAILCPHMKDDSSPFSILRPNALALQRVPLRTLEELDDLCVEASYRCTVRGRSEENQLPMYFSHANFHPPTKVCVRMLSDERCALWVRHTHCVVQREMDVTLQELSLVFPPNMLHVHFDENPNNRAASKATIAHVRARARKFVRKDSRIAAAAASNENDGCQHGGTKGCSAPMCVVCHGDFEDGDVVTLFGCPSLHEFHLDCILPWLARESVCPLCRFDIEANGTDLADLTHDLD